MNIETTYDVVVLAESAMYLMLAVLALALTLYTLCAAWHRAADAAASVEFKRRRWEDSRQRMLELDDGAYPVHQDTAEYYRLDDE